MTMKFKILGLPWWITLALGGCIYLFWKPIKGLVLPYVNKFTGQPAGMDLPSDSHELTELARDQPGYLRHKSITGGNDGSLTGGELNSIIN